MQWLRDALARIQWFKENRLGLGAILLVNLGGIAYGFYYYLDQFALTPPWLWVFVPDSPWAVLWAQLALLLYWFGKRRSDILDALAFVGNVQVGLWTAYVLVAYWDHFRIFSFNLNFALLWLHLGMVALAFLFVRDFSRSVAGNPRKKWTAIGAAAGVYLVNDVLDYFAFRDAGFYDAYAGQAWTCGIRPITVPCVPGQEAALTVVTFGLTIGSALLLAWLVERVAPPGAGARDEAMMDVPVRGRV